MKNSSHLSDLGNGGPDVTGGGGTDVRYTFHLFFIQYIKAIFPTHTKLLLIHMAHLFP